MDNISPYPITTVYVLGPDSSSSAEIEVPAGCIYKFKSLRFKVVCDATVGNRLLRFGIRDPSGNFAYWSAYQTAVASETHIFIAFPGAPYETGLTMFESTAGKSYYMPFPDIALKPGYKIYFSDASSVAAADAFTIGAEVEIYRYA